MADKEEKTLSDSGEGSGAKKDSTASGSWKRRRSRSPTEEPADDDEGFEACDDIEYPALDRPGPIRSPSAADLVRFTCPVTGQYMANPVKIDHTEFRLDMASLKACLDINYIPAFLHDYFLNLIKEAPRDDSIKKLVNEWCVYQHIDPVPRPLTDEEGYYFDALEYGQARKGFSWFGPGSMREDPLKNPPDGVDHLKESMYTPKELVCGMSEVLLRDPVLVDGVVHLERSCIKGCERLSYIPRCLYTHFVESISWSDDVELKEEIDAFAAARGKSTAVVFPEHSIEMEQTGCTGGWWKDRGSTEGGGSRTGKWWAKEDNRRSLYDPGVYRVAP